MTGKAFSRAGALAVCILVPCAALATPDVDPATNTLCAGYDETVEGVWMDASGWEMLRFRFARNADDAGCYAWLNKVSKWKISNPGATAGEKVRKEGGRMVWGDDENGVWVDLTSGEALYIRNGRRTKGKLLD